MMIPAEDYPRLENRTMKYLMLIKHSESLRNEEIPAGLMDAMGAFVEEGFGKGWLKDTAGLKSTAAGYRIRQEKRKLQVTDGPFTETKEVVGGYATIEAGSDAEARALATRFMELHLTHWPDFVGECEVRPCEEM